MRTGRLLVQVCIVTLLLAGCGDASVPASPTPVFVPTIAQPPAPPPATDTLPPVEEPPTEEPPTEEPPTEEPPATIALPGSDWQDFTSEPGNFRVSLPGKPQEQIADVDTPLGKVKMHQFLLASETLAFIVTYADYPTATQQSAVQVLQTVRADALKAGDTEVLGEDTLVLDGFPGLALRTQTANAVRRLRAYFVGNRLYTLSGATAAQSLGAEDVARFLDSFALLHPVPTPTATAIPGAATPARPATPTQTPRR